MSAKRETDNVELTHVVMTTLDSTPGGISDEDNRAAHLPDQSNGQHSQHQDHPHHRIATDNIHGAEDGCENEKKIEHAQLFGATPNEEIDAQLFGATPNEETDGQLFGATPNEETDGHSSGTDRGLLVRRLIYIILICAYFVYLTLALTWNLYQAVPVLCITLLVVSHFTWRHLSSTDVIQDIRHKITNCTQTAASGCLGRRVIRLSCYGAAAAAMLIYSVVINIRSPENLISLAGVVTLLLFSWLISHDRTKICLRPVVWGLGAQLCLGVLVLKTTTGGAVLQWLGHQVELFLNNVTAGVSFVFGEKYEDFLFAFKLMPTVLFVSSVMSVLYYMGVMHVITNTIAVVLRVSMGTTAPETISTAASIFLGQPEASFTIRPYLKTMTNSELHAIMTAGFASVSVDLFGLFVNYGISSAHILTAVLMSAPAGLAVSKIVCPQPRSTVSSEQAKKEEKDELKGKEDGPQNVIDAAARGAQDAVPTVLAVGATLIAFLSILQFLNAALTYLGSLVHIENLTMELVLSYLLMPLVFVMGVPWGECRIVGEVVGLKTILNEFVGYERLGQYIQQRALSRRSQVIATYALCGFSNPTTVGVTLGGLGSLVPERKKDLARLVISAWISGCVTCFLTACFAGLFYEDDDLLDSVNSVSNTTTTAINL